MQFKNFMEETFCLVKAQRQASLQMAIACRGEEISPQPTNLYLEVLGVKGKNKFKFEEWSWIVRKSLDESDYGEELDSSLESVDLPSKSAQTQLKETLLQLNPAEFVKLMEFESLQFRVTRNEEDLLTMESQNSSVREVSQQEGENFKCELIVKYNYEGSEPLKEEEEEFELLIDEEYERRKRREERKLSENLIYGRNDSAELMKRRKRKEQGNRIREQLERVELPGRVLKELTSILQ